MRKHICLFALGVSATLAIHAQTKIKDGTAAGPALPNANAVLELESTNKGLLLPRIALDSTLLASPLTAHTAGMSVYNTATIHDVTPGSYYNDGTRWIRISSAGPYKEPWYKQGTSTPADSNTQHIYQNGKVAVGFSPADIVSSSQLEIKGDLKAHFDGAGNFHSGLNTHSTEFGIPMSFMYLADSANVINATRSSSMALYSGMATLQSSMGANASGNIGVYANASGGAVGLVANSISDNITSAIWGISENNASGNVNLYHQKQSGEGTNLTLEKTKGVTFAFLNTSGALEGSYTFPRGNGTNNQVMVADGNLSAATLTWKDIKNAIGNLPVYANDAAADADTSLAVGGLYKITGSRVVYQKP